MCGIAGIIAPQARDFEPHLGRMVRALKHRGPDGDGMYFYDGCGLGHTRLSIVDLAGGHQPMLSPDGRTAITFNGEIYGYKALRDSFSDYPFRTSGDTELILALYQRYQRDLLRHLPGMFAFALWDQDQRQLFCARDRFGEKPFFYAFGEQKQFIFASEIKAILASRLIEPVMSRSTLRHYLRRGYSPTDRTIYSNVHALPPAHQLIYRDNRVTVERYWELPLTSEAISLQAAAEQFRHLFEEAVSRQLVADVPVGAFLSGGLDSSSIVAVAAQRHPHCKTFSFGFGDSINELPFAREIAQRYGTEHIELTDSNENIASHLEKMQDIYDEPFGDSSNIPTFLLSKLARQYITVALAGEGSDELTCGYNFWYRPLFNLERANAMPDVIAVLIRAASAACKIFGRELPRSLSELWEGFFLKWQFGNALDAHHASNAIFSEAELDLFGLADCRDLQRNRSRDGDLDSVLRDDLQHYLAGDVLTKTDRASMASGLEIRCPFLDVEFASFCIALPIQLKIDTSTEKLVLRRAFEAAWTPSIRTRGKQGFGAPVGDWLKRSEVQKLKNDLLNCKGSEIYQHLPALSVEPYIGRDNYQTWLLLVLALWLQKRA
jgi:asparagine synthase (glutamine-hydrolysing)